MAHYTQIIDLDNLDGIEQHSYPSEEAALPPTEPGLNGSRAQALGMVTPINFIEQPALGGQTSIKDIEDLMSIPPYTPILGAEYLNTDTSHSLEKKTALSAEQPAALIKYSPDFRADSLFLDALHQLQLGAWPQATLLLNVLKAKYPQAQELEFLVQDVALKAELEHQWGVKVKGRRVGFAPLQLVSRLGPIVVIAMLVIGGFFSYGYVQRARGAALERNAIQEQAQTAIQTGAYNEAIELFNQLLALSPEDATALKGLAEARKQLDLQKEYKMAVEAMKAGNTALALKYFTDIEAKATGYRDVQALVTKIKGTADVAQLFTKAEAAYQGKQWLDAIQQYEGLRQVDGAYQADVVTPHLIDAYLHAGQQIVAQLPSDTSDPQTAKDYFGKVLKLKTTDATAQTENNLVDNYLKGLNSIQQNNADQAIQIFQTIYQARPQYVGGYLAEQLYQTYLKVGRSAQESGNLWYALTAFSAAAELQVRDTTEAKNLLNAVTLALTPTPTTMPTEVPVPPAPTATPIPPKLSDFSGWIIFKTDREGGLGVMKPDGSNPQVAPADAAAQIAAIYEKESWSPDHNSHLYVTKSENGTNGANIFKLRADLPENWERVFTYTDQSGDEYDPVWSPDNKLIAYVANGTGNDEIWVMNSDGTGQKQLTVNTWEWDKHPTWSPDGQKIVFYSNRTGKRQLWSMNPDGSAQTLLSNGQFEEWDPIWIK
ncbi:hypothetical protein BH10CHL1_BH10CHL1_38570 [soil metagenome]